MIFCSKKVLFELFSPFLCILSFQNHNKGKANWRPLKNRFKTNVNKTEQFARLLTQPRHQQKTHIAVFLLNKLEKRWHIRPTKMVNSLQSGKHASALKPLEMIFTNVLKQK